MEESPLRLAVPMPGGSPPPFSARQKWHRNCILSRDNLSKRQHVEDLTCLFCEEHESVYHLLFGCIIAHAIWEVIVDIFQFFLSNSMDDLCAMWFKFKKMVVPNMPCIFRTWHGKMSSSFGKV